MQEGGAGKLQSICVSKVMFLPTSTPEEVVGEIFDHTLSKEIFDSGSALVLFFLHLSSHFISFWRVVKQLSD